MENKICGITGHRPQGLPWQYNERGLRFIYFKRRISSIIKKLIKNGTNYFISGMAIGSDMIISEFIT